MNWPDSLTTVVEDSHDALAQRLAGDVKDCLEKAIAERGTASLMVSGGSTPQPFFAALSAMPLDWAQVTIGLVDERYVDAEHADSNERLVRENLLVGAAAKANFMPMYTAGGHDAATSAHQLAIEKLLDSQAGKLDVVILGMGGDAHTASLFPQHSGNHQQIQRALDTASTDGDLVCTMIPAEAPHQRLSLTLKPIIGSRSLFLHITGESKQQVLLDVVDTSDPLSAPIAAVFQAKRADPARIYWAL